MTDALFPKPRGKKARGTLSNHQFQKVESRPEWSGPLSGQAVMGPQGGDVMRGTGAEYLGADPHGNYNEENVAPSWDPQGTIHGVYDTWDRPKLMAAAQSAPTTQVRTDTPLHTLQPVTETEDLYDAYHGPERRKKLDADIAREGVKKPISIVIHQGRPIVMDGHHRLLAARKAGHATVPAKVFNHDEHVRRGGSPILQESQQDPYDLGSLNDLLSDPRSGSIDLDSVLAGYGGHSRGFF